jgi:hypothetical protein
VTFSIIILPPLPYRIVVQRGRGGAAGEDDLGIMSIDRTRDGGTTRSSILLDPDEEEVNFLVMGEKLIVCFFVVVWVGAFVDNLWSENFSNISSLGRQQVLS